MRRASRGSHQFTWRNGPRRVGGANNNSSSGDRKPLVLSTYLDAQEHLPYADDSAAVTPMSEDNGAIVVPPYTNNLGEHCPSIQPSIRPSVRQSARPSVSFYISFVGRPSRRRSLLPSLRAL